MIELWYHTFISENMGVASTRPRPFRALEPPLLEFLEIITAGRATHPMPPISTSLVGTI